MVLYIMFRLAADLKKLYSDNLQPIHKYKTTLYGVGDNTLAYFAGTSMT